MFENGERESQHQPPKAAANPEAQPVVLEAQPGTTAVNLAEKTLEKDPKDQAAKTPEQPVKPPERTLSAAEKQELKTKAVDALNSLIKEAGRVASSPDYFALLGLIPGQADIKDGERVKAAYRDRVGYFHPDKANRKVAEILGEVGKLFPELADQAQTARLACEEATKKLNEAGSFLSDASRREKYLAEKYQIRVGLPQAETTQKAQTVNSAQAESTGRRRQEAPQRTPAPDWVQDARAGYAQGFQDWREAYQSDAWQDFTRNWNEQYQPFVEKPREYTSLIDLIREGKGERHLTELRSLAQEALQEVKDVTSLKQLLELVLAVYEILKSMYSLKREKRGLPVEVTMMSLKGVLAQLKRPEDGNQRWMTKLAAETRLNLLKNSIKVILDYLKPEPLGPSPFRNRQRFDSPVAASL